MLFIELEKPSLVSFIGAPRTAENKSGRLTLTPGDNEVDESTFLAAWQADPLMRGYYEAGHFKIYDENDSDYVPPGAKKPGRRRRSEPTARKAYEGPKVQASKLVGEGNKSPTSELRNPNDMPEQAEPEAPAESIEPMMMGGGVPGDVATARAAVVAETDIGKLRDWADVENRNSVLKVINKRISVLEGED